MKVSVSTNDSPVDMKGSSNSSISCVSTEALKEQIMKVPDSTNSPVDMKGSNNNSNSGMSTEELKEHLMKVSVSTNSLVDLRGSSNHSDSLINTNNSDSGVSSEELKEHLRKVSFSTNSSRSQEIPSLEKELEEKSKTDTYLSRRRETKSLLETFQKLCPPGGYKEELREVLGRIEVPVVFVKGRFIGGANKVKEMNEEGELSILLDGIPNATA
ncbi:hypothetical protein IFM89_032780 [Coptis chinensis]|uniref:Glutaredoxin domain-containing protein n=1 Tax=Coptis chinensis TaxID=261450 RepID=A0A835MGK0_9MAGN|nr:hypothetical protein IFM89_032780 [Coptis chinensis]